ncbi:MAG: L-2-hydroxyglutarate oxidase [Magnetococcales bacterium]|nr:L-2-hydroxyglutarate oxidase [Magnetococcales bacterium]
MSLTCWLIHALPSRAIKLKQVDFLIVGGGVIGLCLALEAKRRYPEQRVMVLEKESFCGAHASGRNSGVLHAGFYYAADSLKARFTRDGNRAWRDYCQEHQLSVNSCGKLVVAQDEQDLPGLDELWRRAQVNGIEMQPLSAAEARELEPRVKTYQRALFSPTTAVVDPKQVMRSLTDEVRRCGIDLRLGSGYRAPVAPGSGELTILTTTGETITAGYLINAAGLQADRVAHDFGFAKNLVILPFKGLYLYSDEPVGSLRLHVYPVPNLNNPFLGVHYTVTVDGHVKIGPTAIPAFWREHYTGLQGFNWRESLDILWREAELWWRNEFDFRRLAWQELSKYRKGHMVSLAERLVSQVDRRHYRRWGAPGVRAQLLNTSTRKLEMDFCYEGDHRSFHVLNAVSPGFTCAIPFSRFLFDQIESSQRAIGITR